MERIKILSGRKSTFPLFRMTPLIIPISSVVPMDWRAMSRSRTCISMDWRPTSRSRSRPPESTSFDQHGLTNNPYDVDIPFPAMGPHSSQDNSNEAREMSISNPIPGSLFHSNGRRSPTYRGVHPRTDLSVLYEGPSDDTSALYGNSSESRFPPRPVYHHLLSPYNSPTFAPSSPPTAGLRGPAEMNLSAPLLQRRSFPEHVRKTSFDHTVSKDGIHTELKGHHQLNGKPQLCDNLTGTKRRAETVLFDSLLRADSSKMDGTHSPRDRELPRNESTSPFPSTSFDFSFRPYEGIFNIPTTASAAPLAQPTQYPSSLRPNIENSRYHSSRSSTSTIYQSPRSPPSAGEGLSAAAAVASAAIAEEYAHAANVEGSVLNYRRSDRASGTPSSNSRNGVSALPKIVSSTHGTIVTLPMKRQRQTFGTRGDSYM